jgi:hypothetical protein
MAWTKAKMAIVASATVIFPHKGVVKGQFRAAPLPLAALISWHIKVSHLAAIRVIGVNFIKLTIVS